MIWGGVTGLAGCAIDAGLVSNSLAMSGEISTEFCELLAGSGWIMRSPSPDGRGADEEKGAVGCGNVVGCAGGVGIATGAGC